jgi:formate hydrogenlyase transcriptional activator
MGRRIETIPTPVMDALMRYSWPGNIREMQNVIERAVILSPGAALHIPVAELKAAGEVSAIKRRQPPFDDGALPSEFAPPTSSTTLADAEREHILRALREARWVLGGPNGAAARLAMKRTTLQSRMKKLGISRPV